MAYFLTTERLRLRPFSADDLDNLAALDSDPEVMRYLTGGRPTPREEAAENLAAMIAPRGGLATWAWAAEDLACGGFLGWFSLRRDPDRDPGEVALGYRVRRAAWGRGLASEGAAALIDEGFQTLAAELVFARTMSVNLASRRVMEKAGLSFVRGFFSEWPEVIAGGERGDVEYAISRDQWARRSPAAHRLRRHE